VTKAAEVEILLSGKRGWFDDKLSFLFVGMAGMEIDMPGRGAVTFLAIHAIDDVAEAFGFETWRREDPGVGAVTFQAPGRDGSVKDHGNGRVQGAVRPFIRSRKIRHGQLEQAILKAGDIGLALGSRTYYDVDTFGNSFRTVFVADLIKPAVSFFHYHAVAGIVDKAVLSGFETSFDVFFEGGSGS